jgi:hypothetical protein
MQKALGRGRLLNCRNLKEMDTIAREIEIYASRLQAEPIPHVDRWPEKVTKLDEPTFDFTQGNFHIALSGLRTVVHDNHSCALRRMRPPEDQKIVP